MNMNGVHCQVSPISTISLADQAWSAHDHAPRPSAALTGANGPFCMSASMRNMYATPTGVTISGMKKTTRKKPPPTDRLRAKKREAEADREIAPQLRTERRSKS